MINDASRARLIDFRTETPLRRAPWHRTPPAQWFGGRPGSAANVAVVAVLVFFAPDGTGPVFGIFFATFAAVGVGIIGLTARRDRRRLDELAGDGWAARVQLGFDDVRSLTHGDPPAGRQSKLARARRHVVVRPDDALLFATGSSSRRGPTLPLTSVTLVSVDGKGRPNQVVLSGEADVTVDVLWSSAFPVDAG